MHANLLTSNGLVTRYDSNATSNDADMRFTFHSKRTQMYNNSKNIFDNAAKGIYSNQTNRSSCFRNTTFKFGVENRSRNQGKLPQKRSSLMKNNVSKYF